MTDHVTGRLNQARSFLGLLVDVVVDRPLGSRHPIWQFAYPVNYGFVPGTTAPDGEPLDAYILGIDEPLAAFTGRCVAVIRRRDDVEDKLVVVADGHSRSPAEIMAAVRFQEQYFDSVVTT